MTERALSVVIPAHDEEVVIGRLLDALADRGPGDEVVVVCDGCSDATAQVAGRRAGVVVVEQARGGKAAALNAGDAVATVFPRFYVDADVVVTMAALRDVGLDDESGAVAGAPRLRVDLDGASWPVRAFYDVWTRLPYVRDRLLGSGVYGVTEQGRRRFGAFPDVVGDDEFVRRRFSVAERADPGRGTFTVVVPRQLDALVDIKTRGRLGIKQLDALDGPAPASSGRPGRSAVVPLARDPRRWPSLVVFACVRGLVGVRSRRRLRAGDTTWDRDESSRTPVGLRKG